LARTRDIIVVVVVVARLIVESEKSKLLFHPRDSSTSLASLISYYNAQ
jgi:hypothetical protein